MNIKDVIKSKRLEKGLTMKMLADAIAVSEGTISRIESGDTSNMRLSTAAALSNVLDIPSSLFFEKYEKSLSYDFQINETSQVNEASAPYQKSKIDRAADVLFTNDIIHTTSTVMEHITQKCHMAPTLDKDEDALLRRRLHSAIALKKYTIKEVAEATDLAEATIEGWLDGTLEYYWPNQRRISTGLSIPFKYLDGEYIFPFKHEEEEYLHQLSNKNAELAKIPYIGTASIHTPYTPPNYKLRLHAINDLPADFCLTQGDDSLKSSLIQNGDLLFCKELSPGEDIQYGQIVILRHMNKLLTMRYYHDDDLHITHFLQDMPEVPPLLFSDESRNYPEILGIVVLSQRRFDKPIF